MPRANDTSPSRKIADLIASFPMRRSGNGRAGGAGAVELGWYRGRHTGLYEAYKALRKVYPAAAALLLKKFGMDEKGNML